MSFRRIGSDATVGTTHTNSTDEAVLKSFTFPANSFQVGKSYRFCAGVEIPSTNSTDTLVIKARLGGTTLTGTVLVQSATIDVADDDSAVVWGEFTVTAVGSAGTVESVGFVAGPDAAAVATGSGQFVSVTSLDTTAALYLEITADWSVAHASNQCAGHYLMVDEIA